MATAEKIVQQILIPPPVVMLPPQRYESKQTGVTLRLSMEEAEALQSVTGKISGCIHRSARRHTDAIREALSAVGIGQKYPFIGSGNINFEDGT